MLAAPCDLADEHSDETWQPEPDHLLGCSMVAAEPEAQSVTFSPYDGTGRDDSQSSEGGDSSHHNDNMVVLAGEELDLDDVCDDLDSFGAPGQKRKQWTQEEDELVRQCVGIHGTRSWTLVAQLGPEVACARLGPGGGDGP